MATRAVAAAAAGAILASVFPSALASTSIYAESGKLIRSQTGMTTLGPDLFGDKVSMYTGGLEFTQTDVSLPSNNALQVSMGRRLETGAEIQAAKAFGNWDYDIPHLHGTFSSASKWTKPSTPTGSRCSGFGVPPTVTGSWGSRSTWNGTEYWHGSFLYVPGAGDQEILQRNGAFTGTADPLITTGMWTLRCGVTLQSPGATNESGEGFMAISPDGTQYRFDWMAVRGMTPLEKASSAPESFAMVLPVDGKAPAPQPMIADGNVLDRVEVWIMPTQVTDKFGNTVNYVYDPVNRWQLNTITASDGRKLTINWSGGKISTVSDGSRTWTYNYSGNTLGSVVQQDGSAWQVGEMANLQQTISYINDGGCTAPPMYQPSAFTASMTHPSGATGTFTLAPVTHGRSFVYRQCDDERTQSPHLHYPMYFDTLALQTKTISGAGLSPLTWRNFYGPPNASFDEPSAQLCLDSKVVNVQDPEGNVTRYTFGNRFRVNEGKLLKTESGLHDLAATSGGYPLRTVYMSYRGPKAPANYVQPLGYSYQSRGNGELASHLTPLDEKVTVQQDVNFVWRVDPALGDFDAWGRPLAITRSSSLGYSRSELHTYHDNTSKWVIGQTATVTEVSTSTQMANYGYHPVHASLTGRQAFGLQLESLDYYGDGTLWHRKDGNYSTTTYSNYKLGIAQNVAYPEGSSESAVVNNNGLIASTTDPAGFQSSYDYDAMGRLKLTNHPAGDTLAWAPTTQTFSQSGSAYGLNGTHWMRVTQTGNQTEEVHFDGLLRPALTRIYDAADPGNTSRYTVRRFDSGGQQVLESYPQRTVSSVDATVPGVSTEHDALGRVARTVADSELGPLVTTHSYDSGYIRSTRNPRQYETRSEFFALD
ncbi:RHS repeat protein, partial [Pseudoduganella violaceinigra]|uniref:RHS repeat protein n=1 Tax=Pseudoduganella violaceinigra TaxID=246602 RepID=UPI00048247AD